MGGNIIISLIDMCCVLEDKNLTFLLLPENFDDITYL
jgi:hypothetical protein